ncbi:MAG: lipocalin family protein [Burkholderiales bacterium]|nr:lipocalin family protein [Burkholderiales bacterium]
MATAALLMGVVAATASLASALEPVPVSTLDLNRYLGTWHEIASIPQFFQRKCVRDSRANYSLVPGDQIRVENTCTRDDGGRERADGRARRVGDPRGAGDGRLEVSFVELWGEHRFWFAADYWVIALDPDYRWAVVGHPSRRYGWVLAREPRLAPAVLAEVIGRIKSQGYDACEFIVTPQTGGLSVRRPLCEALP